MSGGANPFVPATPFKIYNSYVTDPHYARLLTAGWGGLLGVLFLCNLPNLLHLYFVKRKWEAGWFLKETSNKHDARPASKTPSARSRRRRAFWWMSTVANTLNRPIPLPRIAHSRRYLPLSPLQLLFILFIPVLILSTLLPEQVLKSNPNRLGFFAAACLVPQFLLATKALVPFSALLSTSYVAINFLHRWLGRAIFVIGLAHGSLWLWQYGSSGQLDKQMKTARVQTGLANVVLLFWLNITSLPIIRKRWYPFFFANHVIGFVAFLCTVCYHTPYAIPWVTYGVVVVYGIDLALRLCLSSSLAVASVTPLPGGIARVWIHHLNTGWHAGQHVQLRLLFQPTSQHSSWSWRSLLSCARPFESHPFSICLPASSDSKTGFAVYIRSQGEGTWSGDVNALPAGTRLWAVVEGPYGPPRDLAVEGETCLAVCCGSGATWTLSMLSDLIKTPAEAQKIQKIAVLWTVKRFMHIHWFLRHWDQLLANARARNLDMTVQIHVCDPDTDPRPVLDTDCEVLVGVGASPRPDLRRLINDTIQDAINPCSICSNCRCALQPGNDGSCPRDVESCCAPAPLDVQDCCASDPIDEIQPLSAYRSGSDSEESLPEKKACCGKCGPWDGETVVQPTPALVRDRGLVVTVCGPAGLEESVREAVASVPLQQARRIGGIKVIAESYRL